MARNREQALYRLHRRQNLINSTLQNTCRVPVHYGGVHHSSLPGLVGIAHGGPTALNKQQDMRLVQHEYTLDASFSGTLENNANFQGLGVVVSETNLTIGNTELGSASSIRAQEFDYVVVIDFEATCDKNMEKLKPQEIIEFPSVLVDCRQLMLADCFQTYVRPEHHPVLTDFCTHLTGIQQEQVDKGIPLSEAIHSHDKWLEHNGIKDKNFAVLIWSDWDCKVMLDSECKLKGLDKPQYFNRWINLKVLFQGAFNGRKCNLRKAVEASGLKWAGRAHCGLDDAMNTARLAVELMRRGTILTVTGSLEAEVSVTKVRRPQWPGMCPKATSVKCSSSDTQPSVGHINGSGLSKLEETPDDQSSAGCFDMPVSSVLCYCGVVCKRHLVKRSGPTHGKPFLACGKWSPSEGSRCGFFEWAVS